MHSLQFGRWSTVLFPYYLLEGDTVAPSGLLARLCHAFLVLHILLPFFLLPFLLHPFLPSPLSYPSLSPFDITLPSFSFHFSSFVFLAFPLPFFLFCPIPLPVPSLPLYCPFPPLLFPNFFPQMKVNMGMLPVSQQLGYSYGF